jgi:hypothetical protein
VENLPYEIPTGDLSSPCTAFRRHSRQVRHVHLNCAIPGQTVWAQSRQMNRPSLQAIIGLNSIPTTQCGHRMVNVVSVRACIATPVIHPRMETARATPHAGRPHFFGNKVAPRFLKGSLERSTVFGTELPFPD